MNTPPAVWRKQEMLQEIVKLAQIDGLSHSQISLRTGWSKSQVRRALESLGVQTLHFDPAQHGPRINRGRPPQDAGPRGTVTLPRVRCLEGDQ